MSRQTDRQTVTDLPSNITATSRGTYPAPHFLFAFQFLSLCSCGAPARPRPKGTGQKGRNPERLTRSRGSSGAPDRSQTSSNPNEWVMSKKLCSLELLAQMRGFVVTDAAIKVEGEEEEKALVYNASSSPGDASHLHHYLGLYGIT